MSADKTISKTRMQTSQLGLTCSNHSYSPSEIIIQLPLGKKRVDKKVDVDEREQIYSIAENKKVNYFLWDLLTPGKRFFQVVSLVQGNPM